MQLVFDNFYLYGGIKNGSECWGSNQLTGKYGEVDIEQCNLRCSDGLRCGGVKVNSVYRLIYEKNKLCSAKIKFNELDINGKELAESKGELQNPSGDGQNFVWSFGEAFAESFKLDALRNKKGEVLGFKTGEDCPYLEDGLTFLEWE